MILSQFGRARRAFQTYFIVLFPKRQERIAQKKLCDIYGNEALKERQYQNWFAKFRSGDFLLKNAQRSGSPVKIDEPHTKAIINSDCRSTIRETAEKLNVSHTSIKTA